MDDQHVSKLIETIYDAAFAEDGWDALLQSLCTQFHASQANVRCVNAEKVPLVILSTLDPASVARYQAHYHRLDPLSLLSRADIRLLHQTQVYTIERIMELSDWFNSEFYNDFIRRECDMGQPLMSILDISGDAVSEILFHRPPSGDEYRSDERNLLRVLTPHLNRALRIYGELTGLRAKDSAFETVFATLGASFLLDEAGRILALNARAEELLGSGGPLTVQAFSTTGIGCRD